MSSLTITPQTPEKYDGKDNLQAISQMSHYNQWIFDSFKSYIGSNVLEAGCGNGNITRYILQNASPKRYVGVDLSTEFCLNLSQKFSQLGLNTNFKAMDLSKPEIAELSTPNPFDTIICLNVLEHIQNDQAVLKTFLSMLAPKGRLILQVPAFQFLYGTIDRIDGHYRRYTKSDLVNLLRGAGFSIMKATYFNIAGIPAWIWHGKILKLHTHPSEDVRLWDKAVPFLRFIEKCLPIPMGLSVVLIAEKPN